MDPDVNLNEQLQISCHIVELIESERGYSAETFADKAHRLSELVIALDEWIRRGGSAPARLAEITS